MFHWIVKCCFLVMTFTAFGLISRTQAITIHPAVLKNFVGPYRVPHQMPIPRSLTPFDQERDLSITDDESQSEDMEPLRMTFNVEQPRQAAIRARQNNYDASRAQRGCRGNGPCTRNLDSTLNLLMRMMETGR